MKNETKTVLIQIKREDNDADNNSDMKCLVCEQELYSDILAKSCRLCGMALENNIKDDFCCDRCEGTFDGINGRRI